VRLALGKAARGRILLRARYEGTQAVIEVSDDGAGLRTRAVGEAVVRAGLCSPDEAARMTPSELHDLIYHQGITTAPEVTSISGRGVGMDAVKAAVSRLKGTIQVASEPDRGAVFTIRLPLTLAVMRALLVRSNGETFAIPMAVITQVLRATPEQVEHIGRQPVLRTGGQVLPAVHLGAALQLKHPPDHTVRTAPVLVIDVGGRKLALLVDHLVEAREIVVKKLAGLLGTIRGVTGVTVTGDGAAVLIVNPNDLMAAAEAGGSQPAARAAALPTAALDVLIVDDSVSVRHVLTSFIRKAGLNPITAKDGVEALEVLEHAAKPPDVALLDIEMPRMDGYELTAALRSSAEFRNLPIVMLTSRAGEKHRQKAFRLGATEYLVKPYEEDTLLKVIRRVVNEARARAQGSVHATLA
jgi:chemosensory pili system protein ChpA (sensor histidine kinase/response regulator)